jgi:hypothetical protein
VGDNHLLLKDLVMKNGNAPSPHAGSVISAVIKTPSAVASNKPSLRETRRFILAIETSSCGELNAISHLRLNDTPYDVYVSEKIPS